MSRLNIGIAVIVLTAALSAAGMPLRKAVEAMAVIRVVDMVGVITAAVMEVGIFMAAATMAAGISVAMGFSADLRALAPLQDRV